MTFFVWSIAGGVDHIADALGSLKTSDDADGEERGSMPRTITTQWRPVGARATPPLERPPDPLTGASVQQVRRRHEVCQRHVQQLFIRGEQVAMVAVLPP